LILGRFVRFGWLSCDGDLDIAMVEWSAMSRYRFEGESERRCARLGISPGGLGCKKDMERRSTLHPTLRCLGEEDNGRFAKMTLPFGGFLKLTNQIVLHYF
jgi:hypothetical protein